jgi:hypothetical protein
MRLKITALSQRDSRWASLLLGYNTNSAYSIGMYGCLITCLSAITDRTPNVTNQILKDNSGYVSGGNFVWGKCTALGLTQTYVSPVYTGLVTDAGVAKAKELLKGQYPLLCEIDFNPATMGEEMHFVEVIGYDDNTENFYIMDPWTGEIVSIDRYGGFRRAVIQFRAYDKKLAIEGAVVTPVCDPNWRIERDTNWNLHLADQEEIKKLKVQIANKDNECQIKLRDQKEDLIGEIITMAKGL